MKNLKISLFFVLCALCTASTFAQIKLVGETKVGNEWPGNDYNNEVTHEFFGLTNDSYRPGAKLSIGDYGSSANGGANVFIGEAWGWDSDQLQLQGRNGIYFTIGGTSNIVAAEIQTNGNLKVLGGVYSNNNLLYSDVRLKTNIKNLSGALASVLKMQGLIYDFKNTKEEDVLAKLVNVRGKEDKDTKDLEKLRKTYEDKKADNLNQMGFSAQDVQKIFPQLVKTDENGFLALNYTALIPVAIGSH